MPTAELAATLEHRSGLFGLAGTADLRTILAAAAAGQPASTLAVEVYLHRLRGSIASMAAAMAGLDALVFTGGVGENAPAIRARALDGLAFLGVAIDAGANEHGSGDRDIGADGATVRTLVVTAREDLEIACQVRSVLGPTGGVSD
jgi:acetate kinase